MLVVVSKRYVKNAGAVFSLKYQVVWCPKYRRPVLIKPVDLRLKTLLRQQAEELGLTIHTMEVMPDHVNLFVEVYGSENRPHFAGHSYIREGSQTRQASEQEFQRLIDTRSSVAYELSQWLGKCITLERMTVHGADTRVPGEQFDAVLSFVTRFYVTMRYYDNSFSHPLNQLTVSWETGKLALN